ncbi:MAG: histidine phosphatase family protein [Nitrospirae bacterium]|nr:histidine phosphatase family protein [Nitrospirota bacterium]
MHTKVYLIRHGETEGSEVKRYKGSIDVPLSEEGLRQMGDASDFIAKSLSNASDSMHKEYLREIHGTSSIAKPVLHAVYCSPLTRALRGAEIIAKPHGLKPSVINDLRERSFGIWEGMSFMEIKDKYPMEFEAWAGNPIKYSPMGGESTIEVRERAIRALNKILGEHSNQSTEHRAQSTDKNSLSSGFCALRSGNIAIVAHGGVNRIILCEIMGIPLENIFRIEQDYGCLNIIEFWDKYPVVKLINGIKN